MDMTGFATAAACDRACTWASLAPDGELSELEQRLLDSHLARCGACNRFARQVATVAAELRAAALQPLPQPVAIPTWRRGTVTARFRAVGAAAAVAVMALGIASRAPLSEGERQSFQIRPVLDFSGGDQAEQQALRDFRREAMIAAIEARNRPARHFGNQPA
jgi:ferric-dicitrate binding protein FerR (iron transport regulator)